MQKISVSGPAELLTVIPYQLGFQPTRSVVVVCFHDRRIGLVARLDAVPLEHAARAAAQLTPVLAREAPTSVALIGFEEEPGESTPLSEALAAAMGLGRVAVWERLVVRGGRWYCVGDCDDRCSPWGAPLPDRLEVPAVADFVGLGRAVLASRASLADLYAPSQVTSREVREAIDDFADELGWVTRELVQLGVEVRDFIASSSDVLLGAGAYVDLDDPTLDLADAVDEMSVEVADALAWGSPEDDALDDEAWEDEAMDAAGEAAATEWDPAAVAAWEELSLLVEGRAMDRSRLLHHAFFSWAALLRGDFDEHLPADHLPALLGSLRDLHVRDALIGWLCPGTLPLEAIPSHVVDALEEHFESLDLDRARVDAGADSGVDPSDLDQTRLELLCRHAPDEHAAPILSIAASLAWRNGDGARASSALDQALEVEPGHRLCGLLRRLVDLGVRTELRSA